MNSNNNIVGNIKVIALNVNSLIKTSRRHNLNEFISKNKPDFMLISETKLKHKHKLVFPRYDVYRNDRTTDMGGGTAIICKNIYKADQITCDMAITSFEYTMLQISLNNNDSIFVIAIYKPPTQQINILELNTLIRMCGHSQFIIGGDFNAKHRSWKNHINDPNGNILCEWLNQPNNKLKITMLTGNEQTCDRSKDSFIDLFIFSKSLVNKYSSVNHNQLTVRPYLSDHSAIVFECIISDKICTKEPTFRYNYKRTDWNLINVNIENKLNELDMPTNRNIM